MNYQVVATLGPATDGEEIWRRLIQAGATAFRLTGRRSGSPEALRGVRGRTRFKLAMYSRSLFVRTFLIEWTNWVALPFLHEQISQLSQQRPLTHSNQPRFFALAVPWQGYA